VALEGLLGEVEAAGGADVQGADLLDSTGRDRGGVGSDLSVESGAGMLSLDLPLALLPVT
jgi:hypothetical protein